MFLKPRLYCKPCSELVKSCPHPLVHPHVILPSTIRSYKLYLLLRLREKNFEFIFRFLKYVLIYLFFKFFVRITFGEEYIL
jgi:hypothetical protein